MGRPATTRNGARTSNRQCTCGASCGALLRKNRLFFRSFGLGPARGLFRTPRNRRRDGFAPPVILRAGKYLDELIARLGGLAKNKVQQRTTASLGLDAPSSRLASGTGKLPLRVESLLCVVGWVPIGRNEAIIWLLWRACGRADRRDVSVGCQVAQLLQNTAGNLRSCFGPTAHTIDQPPRRRPA